MRKNVPSAAQIRGWKITPAPQGEPPAPPQAPTDPMHGYTLADLDGIARQVLRMDRWRSGDADERYAAVWHAIAEDLLAAETRPSRQGLLTTGLRASDRHMQDELRHHGRDREAGNTGQSRPHFERYWYTGPPSFPESRIVEGIALWQVMPLLTPAQHQALTALALHEGYIAAAEATGRTYDTLYTLIKQARQRIYTAWHEGETAPKRPWRKDARAGQSTVAATTGQPRLTVSELDNLRVRHLAGETVTAIAASVGMPRQTLSALLRGTYAAASVSAAK